MTTTSQVRVLVPVATVALGLLLAGPAAAVAPPAPSGYAPSGPAGIGADATTGMRWQLTDSGDDSGFRGLDAVSADVAWAASDGGDILRTVDRGKTWEPVAPPGSDGLLFRDVEAVGPRRALVLAVGKGDNSRVFRTDDGGRSWTETFRSQRNHTFFNCMAFSTPRRGIAMSDPVRGKFRIITTSDGGSNWQQVGPRHMPPALDGEFGFAASGTCATARPGGRFWFATGGTDKGRVFRSTNYGLDWQVSTTPVQGGAAAGIFSLAFRTDLAGIAIGGDYTDPGAAVDALARTEDGGVTWTLVDEADAPAGYRSGADWRPGTDTGLAVGPTGSDVTRDGGLTWRKFDGGSFNSVECATDGACWAAGTAGRLAYLVGSG